MDERIPGIYHFIRFSVETPLSTLPFSLIEYLAIKSCVEVNSPGQIRFYCDQEPWGVWWELARPCVEVILTQPPRSIHGIPLLHAAHQADVARLALLLEQGGIYLDLDVMCLRPMLPLQKHEAVLGKEHGVGLCNAVILAERGARFLERWLDAYKAFDGSSWNRMSVREPARLAASHPHQVTVLDEKMFFWPMYSPEHLGRFFNPPASNFCQSSYCVHLWGSLSRRYLDEVTPAAVWERDSECCLLARRFLPRNLAYARSS